MKKLLFIAASLLFTCNMFAQIITEKDFIGYAGEEIILKNGRIDYINTALHLKDIYGLDKNDAISKTVIIDCPGYHKGKIYVEANNWFIHTFDDGSSVIQLSDKEEGVIIGKGFLRGISEHTAALTNSIVDAWVIIRVDIKDDKFRVITTIQNYEMNMGSGIVGAIGGDNTIQKQSWTPVTCFPFDSKNYKNTTSKAFVNCHIWSAMMINKLVEAILAGITGTENVW